MSCRRLGCVGFCVLLSFAGGRAAGEVRSLLPRNGSVHPEEQAAFEQWTEHGAVCNVGDSGRIYSVHARQPIPPDLLECLKDCSNLKSLSLDRDESNFAALASLPDLPSLTSLSVSHRLSGDVEMGWVRRVPNIEGLNLNASAPAPRRRHRRNAAPAPPEPQQAGTADRAVAALTPLERLKLLRLNGQPITDAGAESLARLKQLSWLELNDTPVGDPGMKALAKLAELKTLHLNGTKITDQGVAALTQLPKLENLSLVGTAVTDKAMELLANSPSRATSAAFS